MSQTFLRFITLRCFSFPSR